MHWKVKMSSTLQCRHLNFPFEIRQWFCIFAGISSRRWIWLLFFTQLPTVLAAAVIVKVLSPTLAKAVKYQETVVKTWKYFCLSGNISSPESRRYRNLPRRSNRKCSSFFFPMVEKSNDFWPRPDWHHTAWTQQFFYSEDFKFYWSNKSTGKQNNSLKMLKVIQGDFFHWYIPP